MEMDECTMIYLANLPLPLLLPASFLGGLVLGYAYFYALRVTADLIIGHGHPLLALLLTFGRLAGLGVGFYIAVRADGFALIAALAGVLCAKALMLRWARKVDA
ncbi:MULTISPECIES: ATP synthase subunit I [unclassified Falsihalocynthiibacter]